MIRIQICLCVLAKIQCTVYTANGNVNLEFHHVYPSIPTLGSNMRTQIWTDWQLPPRLNGHRTSWPVRGMLRLGLSQNSVAQTLKVYQQISTNSPCSWFDRHKLGVSSNLWTKPVMTGVTKPVGVHWKTQRTFGSIEAKLRPPMVTPTASSYHPIIPLCLRKST